MTTPALTATAPSPPTSAWLVTCESTAQTGEPVAGAPTYTRLHCPNCSCTFMHRMRIFGHMRINEREIDRSPDTTSTPTMRSPSLAPSPCAPTAISSITRSAHCTPTTLSPTHTVAQCAHHHPISVADTGTTDFSCPHRPCTLTSRIGLIGHLRIHRIDTGEPVAGAPTYTRLHCSHCPRTFIHRMGLFGHMRIHENLR
nr:unnamed protein product [Spirometra erinaceieuropaei]